MSEDPLLRVSGLRIRSPEGRDVVDSISFDIGMERVGLVGESGSGKSLTARALMGLVPRPLEVSAERLRFDGEDLLSLHPRSWARLRGERMSLVLQDARHTLNPVMPIGRQIGEMVSLHARVAAAERRRRVHEMLTAVGLSDPRIARAYPHQLSGGMGQRAMLAMMLINGPKLLIADEPTSALDASLREQMLELICESVKVRRMALLLISHDLHQVVRHCERVLVMYRGRIVDSGPAAELPRSTHPYTRALWHCAPSGRTHGTRLPVFEPGSLVPRGGEPSGGEPSVGERWHESSS
jgi:peptide/nickel transport system ATP-binding protein